MSATSSSSSSRNSHSTSPSSSTSPTTSLTTTSSDGSGASSSTLVPTASNSTSSPFFATHTTGDAASSSTSTQSSGGMGPPSSSLYLFTFLATLFLLLAISSAIIMRGIFLRRRFRRRLEEAIAAGVLLSPSDDGSGGFGRAYRRKLQRPTLFDVSVLPPYFSSSSPQDGSWEKIMPFSGSVTSEKPETKDTPAETDIASSQNPPAGRQPRIRALFEGAAYVLPRNRLSRNRTGARPNPSPATPVSSANASSGNDAEGVSGTPAIPLEQQDPVQRAAEVRVAVMVAMPNPHRSAYVPPSVDAELHQLSPGEKGKARGLDGWGEEGEEEAGVPDVVFGLAEVPLVQPSLAPAPAGKDQIS